MKDDIYGLSWLIERYRNKTDENSSEELEEAVGAIRDGLALEPERFPEFVETYEDYKARIMDEPENVINATTFFEIAYLCLVADHDLQTKIGPMLKIRGSRMMEVFADTPKYGPALAALSAYSSLEGQSMAIALNAGANLIKSE